MKTFPVIGYSVLNNVRKVRIAKDFDREKVLHRNGHSDIKLYEVEKLQAGAIITCKEEAAALLATSEFAQPLGSVNAEEHNYPLITMEEAEKWVNPYVNHKPAFEIVLAQIPPRENGRFIKREMREQKARNKMAELFA